MLQVDLCDVAAMFIDNHALSVYGAIKACKLLAKSFKVHEPEVELFASLRLTPGVYTTACVNQNDIHRWQFPQRP